MAWTGVLDTIRRVLGDGATDKFEFKTDCTPPPDGVTLAFFVGRTRVVPSSLVLYTLGTAIPGSNVVLDSLSGVATLSGVSAPSGAGAIQASYYWHWFEDVELLDFLAQAIAQVGGYTSADDVPIALRAIVLDLVQGFAYGRKAAEYAEALTAGAPDGYSIDTGKAAPNWTKLSSDAMARAKQKFDWYLQNPLTGSKPTFASSSFRVPFYTPRR